MVAFASSILNESAIIKVACGCWWYGGPRKDVRYCIVITMLEAGSWKLDSGNWNLEPGTLSGKKERSLVMCHV